MLKLSIFRNSRLGIRSLSSFSQADLPKCDFKPVKYTGPAADSLAEIRRKHLHPSVYHLYQNPLLINQGHMQYLFDEKGQRYIDCLAGISVVNAGHCHPKIMSALEAQAKLLWHTSTIYSYAPLLTYIEKLVKKLPEHIDTVYLTSSGSEANDLALTMARLYTGSQDILSLRNGYHGMSPTVMPLTAMQSWRHNIPMGAGYHHAVCPNVYRGPWGGKNCRQSVVQARRDCDCSSGECKACDAYVNDVNDLLVSTCHRTKLAGFIAEPIQGAGGVVQYPKNYLKNVYELVRARGGLCIADEVQTGFARTGENYWGFQSHDVVPDMITMAKGIGNGFPLAAVATSREVAAPLSQSLHFNTYGGNPLAAAVGKVTLEVIDEDNLQENAKLTGNRALTKFAELQEKHEVIGDVRGMGLLIGVELVSDRNTKTPLSPDLINALLESTREKFVLVGKSGVFGNVIRIKPPLCINEQDIDYVVAAFDAALTELGI